MRHFLIIFILVLAVILQTTIVPFLSIQGATPNLILVFALILTLLGGFKAVWFYVFLGGLFLDIFSGLPFGLISISLVGASYFIDWLSNNVFSGLKFSVKIGLLALGFLAFHFFLNILIRFFHLETVFGFKYLLWSVIYNLVIAILIFNGIKKIFHKT